MMIYNYLIVSSNPSKRILKIWPDGDENYRIIFFDKLNQFINETHLHGVQHLIEQACCEYGSFWLIDLESKTAQRIKEIGIYNTKDSRLYKCLDLVKNFDKKKKEQKHFINYILNKDKKE